MQKSSKDASSECKASIHEVRCHRRKTCVFQRDLAVLGTNLSKLVLFGEISEISVGNLGETLYCRYERNVCSYLKFYTKFFLQGKEIMK